VRRRGGWNTSFPRRNGRNVSVSANGKERADLTSPGIEAHQAHDPSRPSKVPAGTAGVSGCPVHQAPEQGRGPRGVESGSDWPLRSRIRGTTSEESWRESFLEVTRCEQPAFATVGAKRTSARSVETAPAGDKARCQGGRDLVIRRVLWNGSPPVLEGGQHTREVRWRSIKDVNNLVSMRLRCKWPVIFSGRCPDAPATRRGRILVGHHFGCGTGLRGSFR
jgi:hypothetical protein